MDIEELFKLAIDALKSNVARTLLTMLGVIIGIASVIAIISLGQGSTQSVVDQVNSFGVNVLTVSPGKVLRMGGGGSTVDTLTMEDGEAVSKLNNVEAVSGEMSRSKTLTADGESTSTSVKGVEASYAEIKSLDFSTGMFFSESQVGSNSRVAVVGDTVVEELFGEEADVYAVGETVRIDGKTFKILGVIVGSSEVLIPVSTAENVLFGQDYLNNLSVQVENGDLMGQTEIEIEELLLKRHDIEDPEDADFTLRSSEAMLDTVNQLTGTLVTMLSGIAAISLLVGGIGIMNIMLVTVTERTKEIGLLKAIGAKRENILTQFLIEAVVLTLVGGVIGLIFGVGLAYLGSTLMGIPFMVNASSILLAVGVSVGVGVLFGWYPANKASKLNPIDALRYE